MADRPVHLVVITASVREGRFGPTVARWFLERLRADPGLTADPVDLLDVDLPDRLPATDMRDRPPEADATAARLAAADGFVVVTPEYNHSFPASLKHFIDWFMAEWQAKPVGLVSYGGLSGGLRAVEALRTVFAEVHAVTVRETVSFHQARERFGADGRPLEPDGCEQAAKLLLDQLTWWALALREAKEHRPYRA
ncbi:NAD(P)H-dependent oxidoreductase [Nocardiopsis sp. RSe5-2]|uniref:NAD(P)H-dependent oxidoreductase n=2 Tax=Nocardiopsis endophytica TaxID=3018445 RepID=A0ABT4TY76_9ACTN|nr:NAD(P)H-dependent oxidoreductase [Nocardiopsis endophytica]MDA2809097.1 NAD(P)H-dependent oxidoreductase [Nocardiopsis endophytica]